MENKVHIVDFVNEVSLGDWLWCLHCERVYQAGEYREQNTLQMCPYENCDGSTVLDSRKWESMLEIHPDYPITPIRETNYPLYLKEGHEK